MGQHNLSRMMKPQSVAVVGASEKGGTIGNALMKNLLDGGFAGTVMPVNPKYEKIHGCRVYRSVSELDLGVDLAIIATPIETVPEIVGECVNRKVGGAIVISAGGKEVGEKGNDIEYKIERVALPSEFRIIGPNCLGVIQPSGKLNATFVPHMPPSGNLAFVSQSGGICSSILDLASKEQIGFSHFVSIGSMLDVDFGDMIDYLGNDPSVESILLYIENITNIWKFMSAARSVSRVKPIIVLKAGRSEAGARAAASHTGALVGEDAVYDAAFKRAGIVRVETIEELFDCAELMAKQPRPRGSRLAIITNGGGPGVIAADHLARHGQEPAPLLAETVANLDTILPSCWSRNNPIDILGDASVDRFRQVLDVCLDARFFDGVLLILAPQAVTEPMPVAKVLVDMMKGHHYPIFACWMGGRSTDLAVEFLNEAGIPTFDTPERAVQAFLYMVAFAGNQELLFEVPPKLAHHLVMDQKRAGEILAGNTKEGFLPESEVRGLLESYGMPVVKTEVATTEEQASQLSQSIGYPVVLKLFSPDITHKTDAGGVHLDLRSDLEVREAYQQIIQSAERFKQGAKIEGVAIQPFLTKPDFEILLGAKQDRDFGPVILFGMGGIFTEVLKDRALGLPPMNRLLARRMMQETKAYTLLGGYRNRPFADIEQLEEIILRFSQLLVDYPQIAELDMNPILIKDGKPIIVDSRLLVAPNTIPSPMHLVISPYPGEHEYRMVTKSGMDIFVRPIKPEDGPLYVDLIERLSPTSLYYRFFRVLKKLPPAILSRFTQIDYDRDIALVAIAEKEEAERMLGVARIIGDPDGLEGEFAVLIGDAWQGKGIGETLLRKCLLIAEKRGFKHIHGVVLRENINMIALGKKMGFVMKRGEYPGEYELQINLGSLQLVEGLAE
ncbi:MAG: GNAT family N-acetyltransferase [Desulfobulbaceae bacterium]|nr:GNAT family N-acetyltransferase [Desulfobulbaceae bacterium]